MFLISQLTAINSISSGFKNNAYGLIPVQTRKGLGGSASLRHRLKEGHRSPASHTFNSFCGYFVISAHKWEGDVMPNKCQSSLFEKRQQTWAKLRSPICSGKRSDSSHHACLHLKGWCLHRFRGGFDLSEFQSTVIGAHTRRTCQNLYHRTRVPPADTGLWPRTTYCGWIFFFFFTTT